MDNNIYAMLPDADIVEPGFSIDTPEKAEWALQKIAEEERAAKAYIDVCKAQIKRYKQLAADYERKLADRTEGLRGLLATYMRSGAPVRKAKSSDSLTLPGGVVRRKHEGYKMDPDEDKLIEAYDGTDYVEYSPKLKWAELKKSLAIVGADTGDPRVINADTGEVVAGVEVEYVPEKVEIKVNE